VDSSLGPCVGPKDAFRSLHADGSPIQLTIMGSLVSFLPLDFCLGVSLVAAVAIGGASILETAANVGSLLQAAQDDHYGLILEGSSVDELIESCHSHPRFQELKEKILKRADAIHQTSTKPEFVDAMAVRVRDCKWKFVGVGSSEVPCEMIGGYIHYVPTRIVDPVRLVGVHSKCLFS
jgi:hypothetical protein